MPDHLVASVPRQKIPVTATLNIPDTAHHAISSKEMLKALGAFQQEITRIMVQLGTKGPRDLFSIQLEVNFHERGITKAEILGSPRPGKIRIFAECNGGDGGDGGGGDGGGGGGGGGDGGGGDGGQ